MESSETPGPGPDPRRIPGGAPDETPAPPVHDQGIWAPQHPGQQPQLPLPTRAPRNPEVALYVREVFSSRGIATIAWIAGSVLAAGTLGAILLLAALAAAPSGSTGLGDSAGFGADFGQAIAALLVAIGVALGGGLAFDANVDAGLFSASGRASLGIVPLGVLAVAVTGAVVVARLRLRRDRLLAPTLGAEAARAAIEGGFVALAMTLLTAFASLGGTAEFGGVSLRTRAGLVLVTVFLSVAVPVFLARTALRRTVTGAVDGTWTVALREAGLALSIQLGAFAAAGSVLLVIASARSESVAPLLAGLPLLGNLAVAGAALGQFGGLSAGAGSFGGVSVTAFDIPDGHGWWAVVIAVLGLAVAAVAVGLRRRRTARPAWGRTWQMPLVVFAVWCVFAFGVAGVAAEGEILAALSFGGGGAIGLTWPTPFLAGIGAALVSVGAEFLPLAVYRMNPALLAAFGGRRTVQAWLTGAAPASTSPAGTAPGGMPWTAASAPPGSATAAPPAYAAPAPQTAPAAPADAMPTLQRPGPGGSGAPAGGSLPFAAAGIPAPAPMSPRAKTGLVVALSSVGFVALLAVGTAVTVAMINQSRDPAGAVGEYLALLEQGEAERANELVDPGIRTSERALLTDEVLGAAEHRIVVESVETTSRTESGANVHAVYSLDGERFEIDLPVARGPKELLLLETWRLEEPLLVSATLAGDGVPSVLVGDTEIGFGAFDAGEYATRDITVYPGVYSVTGATSDYVTASVVELRAAASATAAPAVAEVTVEPSGAFEQAVLEQVQSRITKCVEIPTNMDDVCPYVTRDTDLAEMRVVAQAEGFASISLTRFEASPAKIAVRANPSSWDEDPELRESDVTVNGGIEFVDGKPVVTELWMGGW